MPKQKQLNIRSDEAYDLVSRIAERTGRPRADVVLAALLSYADARQVKTLTAEERAFVDELMTLARRSAAAAPAGMTSDHSHLYDERGLPR
ncbi:MAG: type II toxin-antitoxin system VapB family antitoxin [Rhizobiales bacterium]|nr:type II toxin-antitoxin system VapB family antitoxin [Hyphomicrobiales bacterium]